MARFLSPLKGCTRIVSALFCLTSIVFISHRSASAQDVDLALSDLTLTAGSETNFIYSFSLANNGGSSLQGYSMKLTLSRNQTLDAGDFFSLIIPSSDVAAQHIGPNQTLLKSEHYYAPSPSEYLPSGSWYVIAEINYDVAFAETDYTNNRVVSTDMLVIAPYQISFIVPPVVTDITESSFTIDASFDPHITRVYYRYQIDGTAPPDEAIMKSSQGLFSWEPDAVILGLGPAYNYDVYCMGESYDGNVTGIYKIDVTTLGEAVPTLISSQSDLTMQEVAIGSASEVATVSVIGYYLSANAVITTSSNFVISKDGVTFVDQLFFLPSDFVDATSQLLYVKALPHDEAGIKTGTLSVSSDDAETKAINLSIRVFDPTHSDFDDIISLSESGWTSFSVLGSHTWSLIDLADASLDQRTAGEDMAVQIDGSEGGSVPNEDWLISPAVDLSTFLYNPTLRFRSYSSGPGERLVLKYSADYPGYGDPTEATWFDTEAEFAAVNSKTWKSTTLELLNREPNMHFAFVYYSTDIEGSRWTIDNWKITDNLVDIPTDVLTYENVAVGSISQSQSMEIEIAGYGDVTITVSDGFQISADNVLFNNSIVIPANNVAEGYTIFVRFVPTQDADEQPGTLTFEGNNFSVTRNALVGSTSITTAAEKDLRTTGFIYPNPTEGAVHVELQAFENTGEILPVWVGNSVGMTITSFESSASGIDTKLSEVVTNLAPGMYYVTVKGRSATYRNKVLRK